QVTSTYVGKSKSVARFGPPHRRQPDSRCCRAPVPSTEVAKSRYVAGSGQTRRAGKPNATKCRILPYWKVNSVVHIDYGSPGAWLRYRAARGNSMKLLSSA